MHLPPRPSRWLPWAALLLSCATARPAGIDSSAMNPAVAPGEDFYSYANGTWMAGTEIPADRGNWGAGSALAEETNQRLAALLDAAARARATATPTGRLAADYYTAWMDEAGIEARGLAPLQPLLDRLAALPDQTALARAFGELLRADVDPLNNTNFYTENPLGLWVAQGFTTPERNTPYLLQGGLGLPDRAFYLTASPRMEALRTRYREHIATLLRLAGLADAAARADRIYALELRLAATHATREESEEALQANNPWRREDFAAQAPGLDWPAFLAAAGLERAPVVLVWHPGAVRGLAALVAAEPLAVWRDYLVYHALNHHSAVLPRAFAEERFAFYGTALAGTPQLPARWKRALAATNAAVGEAVGRLYVARYFPPASKARVQAMVANLVRAFDRRIGRLEWMSAATKEQARAKLLGLYVGIGYPDRWEDYAGLAIDPADALGNQRRAEAFARRRALALLDAPVDPTRWCMHPQEVNAVNLPLQNALNFPAAILQPPFYDPAASDAVNYGSIGAVIGHEISHSFDDQGSRFDAQGRLRDWWTPEDLAHFQAAGKALVAQYSAYQPFPDLAVNGQLTLSENLADLAGLTAAYDAWLAARAGAPATAGAAFTPEQEFFIAYAQTWRSKMREATLRQRLITDGHAPGQYRALTVRNLDAWCDAFAVRPGQALYLAPAARVRVW